MLSGGSASALSEVQHVSDPVSSLFVLRLHAHDPQRVQGVHNLIGSAHEGCSSAQLTFAKTRAPPWQELYRGSQSAKAVFAPFRDGVELVVTPCVGDIRLPRVPHGRCNLLSSPGYHTRRQLQIVQGGSQRIGIPHIDSKKAVGDLTRLALLNMRR